MSRFKASVASLVCLLLVLFGGAGAGAQTPGEELERAFEQAVQRHQAGDIAGAIGDYQAILKRRPDRIDVRSNLGAALAQLGRLDEAIAEYRRALDLDPDNGQIRFNLALAYYKAALYTEAAGELSRITAAQPENANALLILADCWLRLGEDKKVIEMLTPLDARLGSDRIFAYLLGTALLNDKQFDKGQALIDRIMRSGESAEARALLGAAHLTAGDHRSALEEFERALEINPRLPTLNALYGRTLIMSGDSERAGEAFRRELEGNPNDFEAHLYLGMLLKKEARSEEAFEHLRRASQIRPLDLNARYQMAAIHLASGKTAEAQKLLEEVIEAKPDFVEARVLLAQAYYRLKRRADGDRQREIIQQLDAERQEKNTKAQIEAGEAARGNKPAAAPEDPQPGTKRP